MSGATINRLSVITRREFSRPDCATNTHTAGPDAMDVSWYPHAPGNCWHIYARCPVHGENRIARVPREIHPIGDGDQSMVLSVVVHYAHDPIVDKLKRNTYTVRRPDRMRNTALDRKCSKWHQLYRACFRRENIEICQPSTPRIGNER